MKVTIGTIEHIKQLAMLRQEGVLTEEGRVELFDSLDCLDLDELSELYAIACVGKSGSVELYGAAVDESNGRGVGAAEYLFGLGDLGASLAAGTALLKLG